MPLQELQAPVAHLSSELSVSALPLKTDSRQGGSVAGAFMVFSLPSFYSQGSSFGLGKHKGGFLEPGFDISAGFNSSTEIKG